MLLNVKILESNQQIEAAIVKALLPQVNKLFNKVQPKIKSSLGQLFSSAIKNSPEYASISNGILAYELGLPDGAVRVNNLIDYWISSMVVSFSTPSAKNGQIKASLSISMVRSDLSDVIDSDMAVLIDSNTGSRIEWLSWLSLLGDTTIIKDYVFELGPSPYSRTGGGIMKPTSGGRWQVPSQFSGNIANNWITRSIDSIENEVYSILEKTLKESL